MSDKTRELANARFTNCTWSAIVILCGLGQLALAAPPSVESVSPPVGQRGKLFTLTLQGANLNNVHSVLFYSPDIEYAAIEPKSEYEIDLVVNADRACPLDNIPFRLLGSDGYSEMHTVRITPFPVLVAPSGSKEQSLLLEHLNITVCNVAKSKASDRYQVNLTEGQRLTAEVESIRLGHGLLDMVIQVLGPDRQLMARDDDNSLFRQDPLISFVAPASGRYEIQVHESNYQGGDSSYYLLHVGDYSPPGVAYPAGGQFGSTLEVAFLRDKDLETPVQTVELPDSNAVSGFRLFNLASGFETPTPVPFRLTAHANVMEVEPNQVPSERLSPATAPVAFNGALQEPNDIDSFAIEVDSQIPLRIEAFADSIGSPCDTLLKVIDQHSNVLASNDDWESHDSRLDFYPPESGTYALVVTDKLGTGSRTAVYRVEITPLEPTVVAFLPRVNRTSQVSQTISVPVGNRAMARLGVRRDLADSDVSIAFTDLPAGVHASPSIIPDDQFWVPVVFEASAEAELGGALVNVVAEGRSGDRSVVGGFEQVVDLVAESADRLFNAAHVNRLPVAVTNPVPFGVDLVAPTVPLSVGGSLDIRVTVNRQAEFAGPLKIEFPCLPPWVVGEPSFVIPAGEDSGLYRLQALPQASVRDWPLVALARIDTISATTDTRDLDGREVASNIVGLSVATAPIHGHLGLLAVEQGTTIDIACPMERTAELPKTMTAVLEGLPNRVNVKPVEISSSDSQVHFTVRLEGDAPLGEFSGIQCRLSGEIEGQQVSFVVADETRLLVMPPGKLFRSESGEVLSPLEALRRQAPVDATPKP